MMEFLLTPPGLALVVVLVIAIFWATTRNRFVRLQTALDSSWSGIDVELRRRYDLIPNLVETAKGYMDHERETLEAVVAAREQAASNHGEHGSQIADEKQLDQRMGSFLARAEAYPELKANANFLDLQRQLATTENRIAASRRLHNLNVKAWNSLGETIPWRLARPSGWEKEPYFEVGDSGVRAPVDVNLEG